MNRPENPAGAYVANPHPTPVQRQAMISEITELPGQLKNTLAALPSGKLETKYRNWTVRQIVNHLADSHMNGYIRFKLTLTEDQPTIKPYDETRWSDLSEPKSTDVQVSLQLLEALHARWAALLKSMSDADFQRKYFHPEYKTLVSLGEALGVYSWHGRHHLAQIRLVTESRP
jgi:uncharacterized damage-inducible protein DinB